MANLNDFIGQVATKIDAIGNSSRLSVDYNRIAVVPVFPNFGFQVRAYQVSEDAVSSSENVKSVECSVTIAQRLTHHENESEFTLTTAPAIMAAILDRDWWLTLASVHSFWLNGILQIQDPIERVNMVMSFNITAQVHLKP